MNHLCGEKLQLTTLENSINCQSAERIGMGKHGGRTPATKLRSRNKSLMTQSIRNIDEEMGRVPLPLSTAGRMPAWGSWWMIRESKSRCRTREWLVPHYAIAGGPQRTSQRPQGKFGEGQDCHCLSCPTSTVSILTASSDGSKGGFAWLFLG